MESMCHAPSHTGGRLFWGIGLLTNDKWPKTNDRFTKLEIDSQ